MDSFQRRTGRQAPELGAEPSTSFLQNVLTLPCLPPLNKRFYKKAGSSLFFDTHTAIKILINPEEDSDEGGYQAELALFIIFSGLF